MCVGVSSLLAAITLTDWPLKKRQSQWCIRVFLSIAIGMSLRVFFLLLLLWASAAPSG